MENDQKLLEETQKNNWVKIEAIEKIAFALGGQNVGEAIEECSIADLKHVVELLARVRYLENLAPGFFADTLDTFIPYFVNQTNRAIIKEEAHRRAHQAGFGAEWDAAVKAGESPMQAGYNAKLVDAFMAANGVDFDTAVDKLAEHRSIDPESVKRAYRREKKRRR